MGALDDGGKWHPEDVVGKLHPLELGIIDVNGKGGFGISFTQHLGCRVGRIGNYGLECDAGGIHQQSQDVRGDAVDVAELPVLLDEGEKGPRKDDADGGGRTDEGLLVLGVAGHLVDAGIKILAFEACLERRVGHFNAQDGLIQLIHQGRMGSIRHILLGNGVDKGNPAFMARKVKNRAGDELNFSTVQPIG